MPRVRNSSRFELRDNVALDPQPVPGTSSRGRHGLHVVDSPVFTTEPRRDWQLGVLTGHRLYTILAMAIFTVALYLLQDWIWPKAEAPRGFWQQAWSWGSLLWLGAVIPGTLGLLGMLLYRHSRRLDTAIRIPQTVSWRIVTRGTNIDTVRATIERCQEEMRKTPLFPYVIEVVVDEKAPLDLLPQTDDVIYYEVPKSYRTANGTLFKARGLQYALENSSLADDAWIVHLDEETQPTSSGVKGISQMIREEEESGQLRVGQGAILYHRQWRKHPIMTLADNVRTGDDFARFHFQHRLGRTVFGLHGSYIVVRNDVEKSVGFDFGPVGSITEDAFWALVLMEKGGRARWVDGYLEEQSTQSMRDFVKQRRRWYQGLVKVSLYAPVKLRWRACLGLNTLMWTIAPLGGLYTIVHAVYGFEVNPWIRAMANLSFAEFLTLYFVGLKANLDEYGVTNPIKRLGWAVAQLVLTPFFSLLESVGVASALVRPAAGFHVVSK